MDWTGISSGCLDCLEQRLGTRKSICTGDITPCFTVQRQDWIDGGTIEQEIEEGDSVPACQRRLFLSLALCSGLSISSLLIPNLARAGGVGEIAEEKKEQGGRMK
jgi:hypothetical protein